MWERTVDEYIKEADHFNSNMSLIPVQHSLSLVTKSADRFLSITELHI